MSPRHWNKDCFELTHGFRSRNRNLARDSRGDYVMQGHNSVVKERDLEISDYVECNVSGS